MRYRIELNQAQNIIFIGKWFDESEKENIINIWENDLRLANENRLSSLLVKNSKEENTIIPKNIIINSLIVIAKEKENDKEENLG